MLHSFANARGSRYTARMLLGDAANSPGLTYPGLVRHAWVDGPAVEIMPADGEPWVARFANADLSPNGITVGLYHPCESKLCAVARGAGYVIDVENPVDWTTIPIMPIMGGLVVEQLNLLVFWDFSRFVALGRAGIRWCTGSVSWDGIENVSWQGNELTAEVWDAPFDRTMRAVVNLSDGRVLAGAAPR